MPRSEEFSEGTERARQPQFQSVQQQANRNFQALSVLDNVIPNQNGMGSTDLQRRMVGSQGSVSGRSQTTFDRQLWLKHPEPANRTKTLEG
jgi:hypothetical protein